MTGQGTIDKVIMDGLNANEIDFFPDDTEFRLTQWGCLASVLDDYGIKTDHIKPRVGEHIVQDFLEVMFKNGYINKTEEEV